MGKHIYAFCRKSGCDKIGEDREVARMKFHSIAVDMDGTLLNEEKRISPRTLEVLKRLSDRGVNLVLATGRLLASPRQYRAHYGLDAHIIAANGAVVEAEGKVIAETALSEAVIAAVGSMAERSGASFYFVADDILYSSNPGAGYALFYRPRGITGDFPRIDERPAADADLSILKGKVRKFLCHHDDPDTATRLFCDISDLDGVEVSSSYRGNVEVMTAGCNKGRALKTLMDHLGRDTTGVVAFGDYLNDAPMLRAAGLGVAMAGGHGELLAIAQRIAPACGEDGVAAVLEDLEEKGYF